MNPGVFPAGKKLVIYRGTAGGKRLTFQSKATGDPIDLTGRTFTAQIRGKSGSPLILDITVTPTDLENGIVDLSWTAADTDRLPAITASWGLIDDVNQLWIEDTVTIKTKTPENG